MGIHGFEGLSDLHEHHIDNPLFAKSFYRNQDYDVKKTVSDAARRSINENDLRMDPEDERGILNVFTTSYPTDRFQYYDFEEVTLFDKAGTRKAEIFCVIPDDILEEPESLIRDMDIYCRFSGSNDKYMRGRILLADDLKGRLADSMKKMESRDNAEEQKKFFSEYRKMSDELFDQTDRIKKDCSDPDECRELVWKKEREFRKKASELLGDGNYTCGSYIGVLKFEAGFLGSDYFVYPIVSPPYSGDIELSVRRISSIKGPEGRNLSVNREMDMLRFAQSMLQTWYSVQKLKNMPEYREEFESSKKERLRGLTVYPVDENGNKTKFLRVHERFASDGVSDIEREFINACVTGDLESFDQKMHERKEESGE